MQYLKISGALIYTEFLLILLIAAASAVNCRTHLQEADMKTAKDRAEYIQNVSGREKLYQYIKDIHPDSVYGHWLYAQGIRFFRCGGTGLAIEEKKA